MHSDSVPLELGREGVPLGSDLRPGSRIREKEPVLSQRDIRCCELLRKVLDGKLSLSEATAALGVSHRQVKRLKAQVQVEGLAGLAQEV